MTTYSVTVSFTPELDYEDSTIEHVVELRREFGALIVIDVDGVEQAFARNAWTDYAKTPEPLDEREVRRVQALGGPLPATPSPATVRVANRWDR